MIAVALYSYRTLPEVFTMCTATSSTIVEEYLCPLRHTRTAPYNLSSRVLRSTGFHLLSDCWVKTHSGTRAFSVAVPILWNSLPRHVKSSNSIVSFQYYLKT